MNTTSDCCADKKSDKNSRRLKLVLHFSPNNLLIGTAKNILRQILLRTKFFFPKSRTLYYEPRTCKEKN
jgi:hypothetical protein